MRQFLCAVLGAAVALGVMCGIGNFFYGLDIITGVFGGGITGLAIGAIGAGLLRATGKSLTIATPFAAVSAVLHLSVYFAFGLFLDANSGSLVEILATGATGAVTGLAAALSAKLAG